jgi:hypothetical protein
MGGKRKRSTTSRIRTTKRLKSDEPIRCLIVGWLPGGASLGFVSLIAAEFAAGSLLSRRLN